MSNPTDQQAPGSLSPELLDLLIDEHRACTEPRLRRLWDYYRNPASSDADGHVGRLAQEDGLPQRLTRAGSVGDADAQTGREIVIENDIA